MGGYDIPASLDYVLKETRQERLSYIGNSFGATAFFIAMIRRPDLNRRIDVMVAMAPVAGLTRLKSISLRMILPIFPALKVPFTLAY